nr:hypothetical protein [uncultured Flavobacterium sp.]
MNTITYFNTKKHNLSIKSRKSALHFLIKNKITASQFISILYQVDAKQKIVLFHVLDMMVEQNPKYLYTSLDLFLQKSLNETHESIKRCVSRTIYHLLKNDKNCFNKIQKQQIIDVMFNWILLPSLVATRVNAIHVLFFLIDEEDWIEAELIDLIHKNMRLNEASFLSRGKKIIKLIQKQKS